MTDKPLSHKLLKQYLEAKRPPRLPKKHAMACDIIFAFHQYDPEATVMQYESLISAMGLRLASYTCDDGFRPSNLQVLDFSAGTELEKVTGFHMDLTS